jgi:hypothetical protein
MTIDERLEGLGHNLELLSLETEKYDKHIAQLRTPATDVAGGTARLWRIVEMPEPRLDSRDHRLDKLE